MTESESSLSYTAEIRTIDGRADLGRFVVRRLSSRERMLNALKWLGGSWLIAVIFLPLPVVHFVAVPLFLILGIPAAFWGYRTSQRISGGEGLCPVCKKQILLTGHVFQPEFRDVCPHCANQLYFVFGRDSGRDLAREEVSPTPIVP